MKNKYINLNLLLKKFDNPELQEKYIKYLCGLEKESTFHSQEIDGIRDLVKNISMNDIEMGNFLYSYSVPQLGKEFDLIKVSPQKCIDIELKSESVSLERIKKQLQQNKHYLRIITNNIQLFTFVSSTKEIYELVNDNLIASNFERLKSALKSFEGERMCLDSYFEPDKILVSPLNTPKKFVDGEYLLTDNQQTIKNQILKYINSSSDERFYGLKGAAGTGKTLLIYDIAKQLSEDKRILIVHSGIKCPGHNYIESHVTNIKIIEAKELRLREIKDVDIVIVDEAQRLYLSIFDKAVKWASKTKTICLFSFDPDQKMSVSENTRQTDRKIEALCSNNISELKGKIRTNKKIATFIKCLFDLNKPHNCDFDNIQIIFEPNENNAVQLARDMENDGFTYIAYTPSNLVSGLGYQDYRRNTHKVIGQEFNGVVMILNHYFEYVDGKLNSKKHPNPDYLLTKLLFQGLTRARKKLCLIITKEDLLNNILSKLLK